MKKDSSVYITDILDCIDHIKSYTENMSKKDFYQNDQVQDAVIRRLEIIGEASNQIQNSFKELHLHIPWRKMTDLRNVLIHEYSGISLEIIWNVIQKELSLLKESLLKIETP